MLPTRIFLFLYIGAVFLLSGQNLFAAQSWPQKNDYVTLQLISSHNSVASSSELYVALQTELEAHWHTYWRNPGDSGEPVEISWELPDGVSLAGELSWPVPQRIPVGPVVNYGFEGQPLFIQKFKLEDVPQSGELEFRAIVHYLVCKDICIPGHADLSLFLRIGETRRDALGISLIEAALVQRPVADDSQISGGVIRYGDELRLSFAPLKSEIEAKSVYFFPFKQGILNHSAPQQLTQGSQGATLSTVADYIWQQSPPPSHVQGWLTYQSDQQTYVRQLQLTVGTDVAIGEPLQPAESFRFYAFFTAFLAALVGGIILNLMPCVFPVIALKALAFSAHRDVQQTHQQAWSYVAGVLSCFLILALLLLGLKTAGMQIGWGFQLQSPVMIAALSMLFFVIGLNLIGGFEWGGEWQNIGDSLTRKGGLSGSFFTGMLAVIVATPCTVPFMAGAIAYALTQGALISLTVFMALGLGMALPFLLLAYCPPVAARLPRPGKWMIVLRQALAFPVFATVIWLIWVLDLQAGAQALLRLLVAMLLLGFALWCLRFKTGWVKMISWACLASALIIPMSIKPQAQDNIQLTHRSWSPQRVHQLQAEGRAVFVNFTAAWCITCKVNELTVFSREDVKALFQDTNTAYLVADWTNKNAQIAHEIARHGRAGVPLYLLYPPITEGEQVSPDILPQILNRTVLHSALERANRSQNN